MTKEAIEHEINGVTLSIDKIKNAKYFTRQGMRDAIWWLIGYIEKGKAETHNCQYCQTPLNATMLTGIYECPKCLKTFPDAKSIDTIMEERR